MNWVEYLKQAFETLKFNKFRTFLTVLGIIMGVFSIVTIMSISNATEGYLNSELDKFGANNINIAPKTLITKLTMDDAQTITKTIPEIKNIELFISKLAYLKTDRTRKVATISGVTSQIKNFVPLEMKEGNFLNENDVNNQAAVVVIDQIAAKKLFNKTNVVGEMLEIETDTKATLKVKIVGIKRNADNLLTIMNDDDTPLSCYIPISTIMKLYNTKKIDNIVVSVKEKDMVDFVQQKLAKILKFKNGPDSKYAITSTADLQKLTKNITGVVSTILLVIAAITLLVGGIGIVNILLVSVTERTREIGIRKAIGAQKKDIVLQFLAESVMISGFGGLIGIILGIISGNIASMLLKLPLSIDFKTVILAFLGSVVLGIMFGVYPAKKAADLDPIESLRNE